MLFCLASKKHPSAVPCALALTIVEGFFKIILTLSIFFLLQNDVTALECIIHFNMIALAHCMSSLCWCVSQSNVFVNFSLVSPCKIGVCVCV